MSDAVVTPDFLKRLAAIVGSERLLSSADELLVYECDGYVVEKQLRTWLCFRNRLTKP